MRPAGNSLRPPASTRKRVLIVNCYFDTTREPIPRTYKIPQTIAPVVLAGELSTSACEVRVHNEHAQGHLTDRALLGWADMLVLTGLTPALDRMLHLTAYARTLNSKVVVVAGGPAVRSLPGYCGRFFDYACTGDVEALGDVVRDAFGKDYVAEVSSPRFDLATWIGRIGHAETSRNCNFRCSFCSMTAERQPYLNYDLEMLRHQLRALGRREYVTFIDNNFYGSDRRHFTAKLELLGELRDDGWFKGWNALVTNDFFYDDSNLDLARRAGCRSLFTGVESFDSNWLNDNNKAQNLRSSSLELARRSLDSGIVFLYGLVMDPTSRRVSEIRAEIAQILADPAVPLPCYISLAIPYPGTPFFRDCLRERRILPNTRIRDLDPATLSLASLDPPAELVEQVRRDWFSPSDRLSVLAHTARTLRTYGDRLDRDQKLLVAGNAAILCAPVLSSSPLHWSPTARKRTRISTSDRLDAAYKPAFPVDGRYSSYFAPTMLTDASGAPSEELEADLVQDPALAEPFADRTGVSFG